MKPFIGGTAMDLESIAENPGQTIEELQKQVKFLAQTLRGVVSFINDDLAGHVVKELERAKRFSS